MLEVTRLRSTNVALCVFTRVNRPRILGLTRQEMRPSDLLLKFQVHYVLHRTADLCHPSVRKRGHLKAICQPYLELLSLGTIEHFAATVETFHCNSSLLDSQQAGVAAPWCHLHWLYSVGIRIKWCCLCNCIV